MQEQTLIIDKKIFEAIVHKRRFDFTFYDLFIYGFLSFLLALFTFFLCYNVYLSTKSVPFSFLLYSVLAALLFYGLWLILKLFKNSFYFTKITTHLSSDICADAVAALLVRAQMPFQKNEDTYNVFVCMQYFQYSKSVLETTIIILDDYLLINTRNRNTVIVSLHGRKLIELISGYFKTTFRIEK